LAEELTALPAVATRVPPWDPRLWGKS
jgi:hypothetical protein